MVHGQPNELFLRFPQGGITFSCRVAFVLEEILEDLNSRFLGPVLVAAVIGAYTVHAMIGSQASIAKNRRADVACLSVHGVGCRAGSLDRRGIPEGTRGSRALEKGRPSAGQHPSRSWSDRHFDLGMVAFAATGKLGVFRIGYDDLSQALRHDLVWQVAGSF